MTSGNLLIVINGARVMLDSESDAGQVLADMREFGFKSTDAPAAQA